MISWCSSETHGCLTCRVCEVYTPSPVGVISYNSSPCRPCWAPTWTPGLAMLLPKAMCHRHITIKIPKLLRHSTWDAARRNPDSTKEYKCFGTLGGYLLNTFARPAILSVEGNRLDLILQTQIRSRSSPGMCKQITFLEYHLTISWHTISAPPTPSDHMLINCRWIVCQTSVLRDDLQGDKVIISSSQSLWSAL